jgi:hypothetical protein
VKRSRPDSARALRAVLTLVAAVGAASLLACERELEPPGDALPVGAPLAIESTARLSVGVLEGDPMQEFDRVTTPFLMPDGTLAVPTVGAGSIRLFDPNGTFLRELGRPGQGPGEFAYLVSAWARGDTIEAFDLTQQRLVRFFPSDSVETLPLRGARASAVHGALGTGWATMVLSARYGTRDSTTVQVRSRLRSPTQDSVTTLDVTVTHGMHRFDAPGMSGPHPISPTAVVATNGDEIYVGETLTPVIRVYHAGGGFAREIALPLTAATEIAATLSLVVDSAVALADEDQRAITRERWGSYAAPERLSAFWALIVDELGFLWVRPYDPMVHALALGGMPSNRGGPGGSWLVLAPNGVEVGRIAVPDGFEPIQITRDAVVGIHRDDLNVESVHVHRLARK